MITHPDELDDGATLTAEDVDRIHRAMCDRIDCDVCGPHCPGSTYEVSPWAVEKQWRFRHAVSYTPPGGVCCDGFPRAGFRPATERWCRHIPAFGSRTVPSGGGLPILPPDRLRGVAMSLDLYLKANACAHCGRAEATVWEGNITYNLSPMWNEAGFPYSIHEIEDRPASMLVPFIEAGLAELHANPGKYRAMNPPNGWGSFEGLVRFSDGLLEACKAFPTATVGTWR